MAKSVSVVVTGDKKIDAALKRLEKKLRNKTVRKAARTAAKKALNDFRQRVPVESGSLRDATKVRAMKRSKATRGALGASLVVDRKRLFANYEARTGKLPGSRKQDDEPFFYPTVIEFGDADTEPEAPLRKAVYGNEEQIRRIFLTELKLLLRLPP